MKNTKVQLLVGIAISAVFLYIVLRPVNLHDLWNSIVSFKWGWGVPFIAVTFASLYIRAIRWHFLMKPIGNYSPNRLFSPMMVGFGLNSLLPGRVGEFARAIVLGLRERIPFASVFATVVVERIFDTLTLLLLLVFVFSRLKIDPTLKLEYAGFWITGERLNALTKSLAFMAGLMFAGSLFLLWGTGRRIVGICVDGMPLLKPAWKRTINTLITGFADGLHSLRDVRSWIIISALSLAVWVLVGFGMQVVAWGMPPMEVSLPQGIAITVIAAIAILIPAAPGYWGLMQLGVIFALFVLGIEKNQARALAYAFLVHGLQYFPIVAVGLYCLWRERVSIVDITKARQSE